MRKLTRRRALAWAKRRIGHKRIERHRVRIERSALRARRRLEQLRPSPRIGALQRIATGQNEDLVSGVDNAGKQGFVGLHAERADGKLTSLEPSSCRWSMPRLSSDNHRFVARVPADSVAIVLETGAGRRLRRRLPADEPRSSIGTVRALLQAGLGAPSRRNLYERVSGPLIDAVWHAREMPSDDAPIVEHHRALAATRPEVTLIIPIYGRHDFIEHQLARFALDPFVARQDILYVIDDPDLHRVVADRASQLARLYRVPFRIMQLSENLGYAGACNAGARVAHGSQLLLLNSDVMPLAPGWLQPLLETAAAHPDGCLLGARLLYEDGSVQHDGMRLEPSPFHEALWLNLHPGKGLPAFLFPRSATAEPREAITGACLLIAARDYRSLGGLDERFILGDFEDSDLCLSARAAGLPVLIRTDVELEHLERQSQVLAGDAIWKEELTRYNCWQHSMKWCDALEDIARHRRSLEAAPANDSVHAIRRQA